ncbi:putative methyltransferase [Actinoplanes missouriensis 431]|uniref:Putative methyltransferase n=1 Tax=Actinoplanes missouriensis (strain ATCC 14538 / DSM 43046 / CBS 188.64 / JCM 3121 / NBRC 102363 / NCIMB 12654 / NRRL B-3342 / UNCC 431) TaxID=512565 RepID=I0H9S4_ACTM4|nr:class I SAM-dependent methyltransferase [Actinoplanes missouriensis]BAL89761.1 putative methyltransferase [Actinoplanes missouriensis 431]
MGFEVGADAYGRFMGRYSFPLGVEFADRAGLAPGLRALDVGCGTGALTTVLVERLGAGSVVAVDPSASFVEAIRARLPEVDVRQAPAERLPFPDGSFDVTLAQLVVHFMTDPVAGLREMGRVTRPGGLVGACVWDHAGGRGPLTTFWQAVRSLDPAAPGESELAGVRAGHLAELFTAAGLRDVESGVLTVQAEFAGFEDWWEPFTFGVGPPGDYVAGLDARQLAALRERCAAVFTPRVTASAWVVVGRAA